MKFMLFVLPTVPGTPEDRKRLRPIGRSNERYQQMLDHGAPFRLGELFAKHIIPEFPLAT